MTPTGVSLPPVKPISYAALVHPDVPEPREGNLFLHGHSGTLPCTSTCTYNSAYICTLLTLRQLKLSRNRLPLLLLLLLPLPLPLRLRPPSPPTRPSSLRSLPLLLPLARQYTLHLLMRYLSCGILLPFAVRVRVCVPVPLSVYVCASTCAYICSCIPASSCCVRDG